MTLLDGTLTLIHQCSIFSHHSKDVLGLLLVVWPWFSSPHVTASSLRFRLLVRCLLVKSLLQIVGELDRLLGWSRRVLKGGVRPLRQGGMCQLWPCSSLSTWEVAGETALGIFRSFLLGWSDFPEKNPPVSCQEGSELPIRLPRADQQKTCVYSSRSQCDHSLSPQ